MLVLGLGDGLKNYEIMEFGVCAFQIMKSGFYYTDLKQNKSRKLLNLLLKYISTINGPNTVIIIPIFSYDFPIDFPMSLALEVFGLAVLGLRIGRQAGRQVVQDRKSWRSERSPQFRSLSFKNGAYRAQKYGKEFIVFCFSWFFYVIVGFRGF